MTGKFKTYYSARTVLNKGALFNLVLSDRSDGKTFDCKVRALEDFFNNGYSTVYMRRYSTEITPDMYLTFLDDVLEKEPYSTLYGGYKYKCEKSGISIYFDERWQKFIYFLPLSKASKLKSQLYVNMIHTIDFDEYVPLDGIYLQSEAKLLLEFYKSVDRDRGTTQLIMLGNKITEVCPVLDFFNISVNLVKPKLRLYRNGSFAVEIYASQEHREHRAKMMFNDLVAGTEYDEYDKGGYLKIEDVKIGKRADKAKVYANFKTETGEGTIYIDGDNMYIETRVNKSADYTVVDKPYAGIKKQLNISNTYCKAYIRSYYHTGSINYKDKASYYSFLPILKKL